MEPCSKKAKTEDSWPVEVRSSTGRGRGLFATRAIAAGETVASECPAVRWVDATQQAHVCGWCLAYSTEELHSVCVCKRVRWCSQACRVAHGKTHAPVCTTVAKLDLCEPPLDCDSDTLFGLAVGLAGLRQVAPTAPHTVALQALCEGGALADEESVRCSAVARLMEKGAGLMTEDAIRQLLLQDKANSFLLALPEQGAAPEAHRQAAATGRAVAIYPQRLAMANHSCWPNAVRQDARSDCSDASTPARSAYIALRDIALGEEITQSYVGIGWPQRFDPADFARPGMTMADLQAAEEKWVPRRSYLQAEYGFECDCERCAVEQAMPDSDDDSEDENQPGSGEVSEDLTEKDMELSVFLMKHLCEGCGGTMLPLPEKASHACNMCHVERADALFQTNIELLMDAEGEEGGESSSAEYEDEAGATALLSGDSSDDSAAFGEDDADDVD